MKLKKLNILLGFSITVVLCLILSPLNLFAQIFSENQIKAALLYKLTNYIRWENPDKKAEICFIGDVEDQNGETVGKTVLSLVNKEHSPFNILMDTNIKDIKNCNMLFIGTEWKSNLNDIFAVIDNKPIVTISDIASFTKRGGMFGFYDKNGNLSIELNFANAKAHNVSINSALREIISITE